MKWFRRGLCAVRGHRMFHAIDDMSKPARAYWQCGVCGVTSDGINAAGDPVAPVNTPAGRFPYFLHCYGCNVPRGALWRAPGWLACDTCRPVIEANLAERGQSRPEWRRITRWRAVRRRAADFVHRIACRVAGKFWS